MSAAGILQPVRGSRRIKDLAYRGALWCCVAIAMATLGVIAFYVVKRGISALSVNFFTKEPASQLHPEQGGIVQSFIGTGIIVGIASLIAIPLGLLTAVYLAEYGKGRLASAIRLTAQVLLSVPSIVAGAFIWTVVVVAFGNFSAFAGGLALVVLMWPIVARATEEVLLLVPQDLREGSLALGLPRWKTIMRVVVPAAGAGILTAVMLAVARALGETAPILLTALGNDFINTDPLKPTDAVPLRIFSDARTPVPGLHQIAWGGALVLLLAVLLLSIGARVLSVRQQKRLA
ncbi:MAG TPA: phosphate ABC transporter permease PstA [Actinomycetota bacterium]|nr:phosphate ABC transporter permease PstA [Actinomycetota bacterium]